MVIKLVNRDRSLYIFKTYCGENIDEFRANMSEKDRVLEQQFINEVNAQGYHIQFINQVMQMDAEERDIVPIIIKYATLFDYKPIYRNLIAALKKPCFKLATEFLLEEFKKPNIDVWSSSKMSWKTSRRFETSAALLKIRSRRYKDEYLKLVEDPETQLDSGLLIELLGKLKYEKAYPVILSLLQSNIEPLHNHVVYALGCFTNHLENIPLLEEIMHSPPTQNKSFTIAIRSFIRLKMAEDKQNAKLIEFPRKKQEK